MAIEKDFDCQSVIISLDVDNSLFDRIKQISDAGFSLIEINSSDPILLRELTQTFSNLKIGACNIITTQQLENCFEAGVNFASSPGFLSAIAQTANIYSLNFLPGVATVSEAMEAMSLGYKRIRPYPAKLSFSNLINRCMPEVKQFPADVKLEEIEHYFTIPNVSGVCIDNPEINELNALSLSALA